MVRAAIKSADFFEVHFALGALTLFCRDHIGMHRAGVNLGCLRQVHLAFGTFTRIGRNDLRMHGTGIDGFSLALRLGTGGERRIGAKTSETKI